jgi:hypothetical protein
MTEVETKKLWTKRVFFWGYMGAYGCLSRGLSYIERPPGPDELSSQTFASKIDYSSWGAILLSAAVLISFGLLFRQAHIAWLGHGIAVLCHLIFTYNLVIAVYQTKSGWVGIFPLFVIAVIHAERIFKLGWIIKAEAEDRDKKKAEKKEASE